MIPHPPLTCPKRCPNQDNQRPIPGNGQIFRHLAKAGYSLSRALVKPWTSGHEGTGPSWLPRAGTKPLPPPSSPDYPAGEVSGAVQGGKGTPQPCSNSLLRCPQRGPLWTQPVTQHQQALPQPPTRPPWRGLPSVLVLKTEQAPKQMHQMMHFHHQTNDVSLLLLAQGNHSLS